MFGQKSVLRILRPWLDIGISFRIRALCVAQKARKSLIDSTWRFGETCHSYGRFLVIYNGYLDTANYAPGRLITVAGEVIGGKSGTLEEMPYRYPYIKGREVHLVDRSSSLPISFGIGVFKSF